MSEDNIEEVDEEVDYEPDLITLEDEDGKEHVFEVIDATDIDDKRYMAVVPYIDAKDALDQDLELIIMGVGEDENGDEYLDVVEDEDELQIVGDVFANRLSEIYDIDVRDL